MLKIRQPQFSVDMGFPPFDPSQLSDVPESATWREATVVERTSETGIVLTEDGARVGFTSGNLLRNRTHWENTKIGMCVWLTERGGISAHPPSVFSPREQYDVIMREQVRTVAAAVDAEALKAVEEIYRR
jgi:hypothetical protein